MAYVMKTLHMIYEIYIIQIEIKVILFKHLSVFIPYQLASHDPIGK
jgi:hypothetical protein